MAKSNNYPSYLPEDFKGLESIQEGNQRYYYKTMDGENLLVGAIVGKRHLVIRFPEGSTIDVIPKDSVGTDEIKDGAVQEQDLNDSIKDRMTITHDSSTGGLRIGGYAKPGEVPANNTGYDTNADDGGDDI